MIAWRSFTFARIVEAHDGDSLKVEVDLGFCTSQTIHVRIYGLSAPELHGKESEMGGIAQRGAAAFAGLPVALWTWKQSFDRYVGRMVTTVGAQRDVARCMMEYGFGRAWDGVTARPAFDVFPIVDTAREVALYDQLLARDFRP